MKKAFLPLSLFCALALPVAAHADTLYTVTNGQLSAPTPPSVFPPTTLAGTYSGTFTLNSNFTITSGSFTATVNGITYSGLNIEVPNGGQNSAGYGAFFDTAGDHLNFALLGSGSATNPTICTFAICGSGDTVFDTALVNNGSQNFYATGGTLSGGSINAATTPEPSSLMLLGTGAVGVAAALRRRFRRV